MTYEAAVRSGVGLRRGEEIVDSGYTDMLDLIREGRSRVGRAAAAAETGEPIASARVQAPLRPGKIGEQMQPASTAEWLFPIPVLSENMTRIITLEPGDLMSTGTPAGVGCFCDPPCA